MAKIILWVGCLCFLACSHQRQQQELEQSLLDLRCDGALKKKPLENFVDTSIASTKYLGKNALAYTYIAGNYTAEVLWDVSTGVVLFVGLCGPMFMVHIANQRGTFSTGPQNAPQDRTTTSFPCLPRPEFSISAPPLGRKALEHTKEFRCPDNQPLLDRLDQVVTCLEDQGKYEKALQTLDNLESSESFYNCLKTPQMLALQEKRKELQKRAATNENL